MEQIVRTNPLRPTHYTMHKSAETRGRYLLVSELLLLEAPPTGKHFIPCDNNLTRFLNGANNHSNKHLKEQKVKDSKKRK